ncbi:hypothetical protein EON82_10530 [bacterium]|nr:MAG: hypothetical protein EON82_10530 [bacterium]
MARWIHEFRSSGERALTEQEQMQIARRAKCLSAKYYGLCLQAVLLFISALPALAIATGGPTWVWVLSIPVVILGFYSISWANAAEKLALLHRRALRIGTVEEFRRVPGDETVKRLWQQVGYKNASEDDEDEDVTPHLDSYWSNQEEFEEALVRSAGGRVNAFEAVGRDGVILFVESHPVCKLLEPSVWEVVG